MAITPTPHPSFDGTTCDASAFPLPASPSFKGNPR
jgi:hypothetical protein